MNPPHDLLDANEPGTYGAEGASQPLTPSDKSEASHRGAIISVEPKNTYLNQISTFCTTKNLTVEFDLPVLGKRSKKFWSGVVEDSTSERFLGTAIVKPGQFQMTKEDMERALDGFHKMHANTGEVFCGVKEFGMSQDDVFVITVSDFYKEGSLRDKIYNSNPLDPWNTKYERIRGQKIPTPTIQRYVSQIVYAMYILQMNGIYIGSHLHLGNILIHDANRVVLGGYEEVLCSLKGKYDSQLSKRSIEKRLYSLVGLAIVIYQMCTGDDTPEDNLVDDVLDKKFVSSVPVPVGEFLQFILETLDSNDTTISRINKLNNHKFLDHYRIRSKDIKLIPDITRSTCTIGSKALRPTNLATTILQAHQLVTYV